MVQPTREYHKEWYHKNREKRLVQAAEYKKNNQEKINSYRSKNLEWFLYKSAKSRAEKTGIEFSLAPEDIVIPEVCPYLNYPITREVGKGRVWTNPSVDRIDNTKGYIKGNIEVISIQANTMKSIATIEQLKQFSKAVLKRYE